MTTHAAERAGVAGGEDGTIDWLLASEEPAIRALVRRDLLEDSADDDAARIFGTRASRSIPSS